MFVCNSTILVGWPEWTEEGGEGGLRKRMQGQDVRLGCFLIYFVLLQSSTSSISTGFWSTTVQPI